MKENDKLLYKTLKELLNEKLSDAEVETLKSEGFEVKNPTRKTAVMVALYKKASAALKPFSFTHRSFPPAPRQSKRPPWRAL